MNLITAIPITKSPNPIDYSSRIISIGSCFAENMAEKIDYFKFEITVNPFGILFHPMAIEKMFTRIVENRLFTQDDIFYYNEQWHSFDVHSSLSSPNKDELLLLLNNIIEKSYSKILSGTHVIITLGTSWVYKSKKSGNLVANCHKIPQKHFEKELLSIKIIEKSLENIIDLLRKVNPKLEVVFTISPVRHIKDGFSENQRSKAHLIAAVQNFLETNNLGGVTYFPSYEILLDELRDYRFYAENMLHPNQLAIDYIWKRFADTNISESSIFVMQEVDGIQKALHHKPFYPESKAHKEFFLQLETKIANFQKRFPNIVF